MPADSFPTRIFKLNTKCSAQPFNKAEGLDKISDFLKEVLLGGNTGGQHFEEGDDDDLYN